VDARHTKREENNMKQFRKALAVTLCTALAVGAVTVPSDSSDAAAKLKLSKKSLTLKVGQTKALTLKKGKKNVTKKAKWTSNKKSVATVNKGKVTGKSAGTAIISAKSGKTVKCTVKVTGGSSNNTNPGSSSTTPGTSTVTTPTSVPFNAAPNNNPSGNTTPTANPGGTTPTATPGATEAPADDFDFTKDCKVTYNEITKHVEFKINKDVISEEELKAQGYEVNDGVASKDTTCPTATYTFTKLPDTLTEIKQIPLDKEFGPMAATICAMATADLSYNMQTIDKSPTAQILDYLNGAYYDFNNFDKQHLASNTIPNLKGKQMCFFDGATTANGYKPNEPLSFTIYVGPYYIPAKDTVTGKRPETYMVLLAFGGDDSERYIDVYKSGDGNWYSFDDNWKHMGASFKDVDPQF
jgi:hypothetical protein